MIHKEFMAAPPPPTVRQDPMFFAEEFAARRRRYVPVTSNLAKISGEGTYKTYTFPFITGIRSPLPITGYPELFSQALNTRFSEDASYRPTTRFEAMTYQAYKDALADKSGALERVRVEFVNSLIEPGLLVDLSRVSASPSNPVGTSSQFDTPPNTNPPTPAIGEPSSLTTNLDVPPPGMIGLVVPQHASHGFLSREFVGYLQGIAGLAGGVPTGQPSPCERVIFKDQDLSTPGSPLYVNMIPFIMAIEPTLGDPSNPAYFSSWVPRNPALDRVFNCPTGPLPFKDFDKTFGKSIDASTVEQAYTTLRRMNGEPFERYLSFIRFLYVFFDHIPTVQPVISALLSPLVGMLGGILQRGRYSVTNDTPVRLLARIRDPRYITQDTTFALAVVALDPATDRKKAAGNVISMYRHMDSSWSAIKMIIQAGSLDPGQYVRQVGYHKPRKNDVFGTEFNDRLSVTERGNPLSNLSSLYANSGLVEFDLPSIGRANMLLPAVLGVPPDHITSLIYELATCWFPTEREYQDKELAIINASASYHSYTQGRIAYTTEGLAGITPPPGGNYIQIIPRDDFRPLLAGPVLVYTDPWENPPPNTKSRTINDEHMPWGWGELLYPAFVSHALVGLQHLRPIANTLVRPCLQTGDLSIVFPPASEMQGGYVLVQGQDLEADQYLMGAVFEFPATVVNITLPPAVPLGHRSQEAMNNYPGNLDRTPAAPGSFIMNRGSRSTRRDRSHGDNVYRLVNAVSLSDTVPGIEGWTVVPMTMQTTPFTSVSILQKRTHYAWTPLGVEASNPAATASLQFEAPASGQPIFLPAIQTQLFLSSFFDWKLQLYYLNTLRTFLEGRSQLQDVIDKIDAAVKDPVISKVWDTVVDNDASRAYIRDNLIPNLIPGSSTYAGFRNVLFNVVGPTAPGKMTDIIKLRSLIDSSSLTFDTKRFYVTQLPTPVRGPLTYNIDIDDYLELLKARSGAMKSLSEGKTVEQTRIAKERETQRNRDIAELVQKSKQRLLDPYSQLIDEVVTRAIYTLPS